MTREIIQWYVLRSPKKNYEVASCVDDCSAHVATENGAFLAIHLDQHPLSFYPLATMPRGKPYSDDLRVALVNMARHLDIDSEWFLVHPLAEHFHQNESCSAQLCVSHESG